MASKPLMQFYRMSSLAFVVSSKENRAFKEIKAFRAIPKDQHEKLRELCGVKEGVPDLWSVNGLQKVCEQPATVYKTLWAGACVHLPWERVHIFSPQNAKTHKV